MWRGEPDPMALAWRRPVRAVAVPVPVTASAGAAPARAATRPRTRAVTLALVAIVLVGGGLRAEQAANPGRYLSSDERSYARVALHLADTGVYGAPGMSDPWHWAPGAPVLFAAAHLIAPHADGAGTQDDLRTGFWAQALVGTLLIIAVFFLASGLGGPIAGLVAAALIATYPPLIRATGDVVSEPLGALTLALAALALLAAWRRPTTGRLILTGLAFGAALLVRADLLIVPSVVGLAWLLLSRDRASYGARIGQACAITIIPLLVALPWIGYASSKAGRVIPIASSGPSTLFVGTYLPGGGKMSGVKRDLEVYVRHQMSNVRHVSRPNLKAEWVLRAYIRERHPELVDPRGYRIPPAQLRWGLSYETRRNLKTYAVGRPIAFAGMELSKVGRMWGDYYRGGTRNPRGWLTAWHLLLVGLSLAGVIAGWALARARRAELTLLLVPVLVSTAVNSVFVAQARHNLRVLPLLVAGGAAGAALAIQARRARTTGLPPEADPPGDQITAERLAVDPQITIRRGRTRVRTR